MAENIREPEEVIRSQRYELVGEDGETRAVLGRLDRNDGEEVYGLRLFDPTGTRLDFMIGPFGPILSMTNGSTEVILLGIDEDEDAVVPGPKLLLCDELGTPYVTLRVPN